MKTLLLLTLIVFILVFHNNIIKCHKTGHKGKSKPVKISNIKSVATKNETRLRNNHYKTSYLFPNVFDTTHAYDLMINPNQLDHTFMTRSGSEYSYNPFSLMNENIISSRYKHNSLADFTNTDPTYILPEYHQTDSSSSPILDYIMATSSLSSVDSKKSLIGEDSFHIQPQIKIKRKRPHPEKIIEEHIFDADVAKYLMGKKENELNNNDLLESTLNDFTNGKELAQHYTTIYEMNTSNKPQSSSDHIEYYPLSSSLLTSSPLSSSSSPSSASSSTSSSSSSSSSLSPGYSSSSSSTYSLPLSSYHEYTRKPSLSNHIRVYPSFSSITSLSSPSSSHSNTYLSSYNPSLPRIRPPNVIPPGAIVGAPGSSPPPGMKLAGYVTVAKPTTTSMLVPKSSQSVIAPVTVVDEPISSSTSKTAQAVVQMMAQGIKSPYSKQSQIQALQALLNGALLELNKQNQKIQLHNTSGSSGLKPKLLRRFNPWKLFKRLRVKNTMPPPITNDYSDFEDRSDNLNYNFFKSYSSLKHQKIIPIKRSDVTVKRTRRSVTSLNDTNTAENRYNPYSFENRFGRDHYIHGPPPMERGGPVRGRGPRRFTGGPVYYTSETRNLGLMGSGNFEVIRGGILPASANGINVGHLYMRAHSLRHSDNTRDDNAFDEDEDDDKDIFVPIDDYFAGPSPGVLGFQGFNHFVERPVFNAVSASNQKIKIKQDNKRNQAKVSKKLFQNGHRKSSDYIQLVS